MAVHEQNTKVSHTQFSYQSIIAFVVVVVGVVLQYKFDTVKPQLSEQDGQGVFCSDNWSGHKQRKPYWT